MNNKQLAYRVKQKLKNYPHKYFSIKEISSLIHIKKHQYRDLKDTLINMKKNNILSYKNGRYTIFVSHPKKPHVVLGVFDATTLARNYSFAFVRTDDYDVYIDGEDTLNAYHNDEVEVELTFQKGKYKHGKIINITKRNNETLVGNIQKYHNKIFFIADNTRIHTDFELIESDDISKDLKIVVEVINWGNKQLGKLPKVKVIEKLGKATNPEVIILGVIRQNNLPLEFPDYVMNDLENISEVIPEDEIHKRLDLRDLTTLTIDPISAKDFDDAISFEKKENGYILYVHIADVAHYVKPTSSLFLEAVSRGNSFYFPKRVIPMLPEKISNKVCSLRPLEDKLTLTIKTHYDKNYNKIKQEVLETIICSDIRLNYEQVDQLFENKENDIPEEICNLLEQMRKLANKLHSERIKRGYISLQLPETEIEYNDLGEIAGLNRSKETESHRLIELFMLVANQYVSELLTKNARTTIYRIHEDPDEQDVKRLQRLLKNYKLNLNLKQSYHTALQNLIKEMPDNVYHRVFDRMILRSMKKAKYSTNHLGHFGLAMHTYTHFTSPIRRLCDLIIHHQIKNDILHKQESAFSPGQLYDYSKKATDQEIKADHAERDVERTYVNLFMKNKIGYIFDGIICNINSRIIMIELDDYPVRGITSVTNQEDDYYIYDDQGMRLVGERSGKIIQLMDSVSVQIVNIDEDIEFRIVELGK